MCVGDWRLGRLIRTNVGRSTFGAPGDLILPENQQRVAVSFTIDLSEVGNEAIGILQDGSESTVCVINQFMPTYNMTLLTHGDIPTRRLVWVDSSGVGSIRFVEHFMPEEYLAVGLRHFETEYLQWRK